MIIETKREDEEQKTVIETRDENVSETRGDALDINQSLYDTLAQINPMDIFRMMAKERGITLREPKSTCPRCHGTGCCGRKAVTHEPIPCHCIIPVQNEDGVQMQYSYNMNRAQRRAQAKKRR